MPTLNPRTTMPSLTAAEWVTVVAIVVGPLFAVQATQWLDRIRTRRDRRDNLFRTLMATRAKRVSQEHVAALNLIDVEFAGRQFLWWGKGKRAVRAAWKAHFDNLCDEERFNRGEANNSFVELLFSMAQELHYDYDRSDLRRQVYSPVGHGNLEQAQASVLSGMAAIMEGKAALPITNTPPPQSSPADEGRKLLK